MRIDFEDHTFVVCAYKESDYLEDCIQSLLKQSRTSNVILYSSTPNDFIKELCIKYRIKMYSKTGGGIGKDWNNALSFVQTKYATIAHQDDYYEKRYSTAIMDQMNQHPECLIAYSDYNEWKNGQLIPANNNLKIKTLMLKTMAVMPKMKFWRNRIMAFGNPICCPAVTYNLELLKDFRFDEELRVSLDWLAWYEINKYQGSFRYVPEKLMYHRIHEESETTNTILDNSRSREDLMMYKKFWPDFFANFLMKFYVKSQETN